ncbi:10516_t:CDS:2, partial [Racocetra persica]
DLLFRDEQIAEEDRSQDQDDQPAQQTQAGEEDEDPVKWVEAFERAADANNWTLARKIKITSGHLMGIAASWYNNHKDDFFLWDDEINPENSFVQAFIKYFATPKCKHQWQVELNTLKQKENEKVDRMFLGGLRGKTAALMSVEDFETLDEAIAKARKIEAGTYYKNKDSKNEATNKLMDDLTQQMQQMVANCKRLTTALAARIEN